MMIILMSLLYSTIFSRASFLFFAHIVVALVGQAGDSALIYGLVFCSSLLLCSVCTWLTASLQHILIFFLVCIELK